jgi:hypothetical protein
MAGDNEKSNKARRELEKQDRKRKAEELKKQALGKGKNPMIGSQRHADEKKKREGK